jgi:hypothetical protein
MPGFGDSATWPAIGNHGDPRNDDEPADEVEQAQDLMGEIREQIDRAEKAVFSREWETYRIAMLNAHDLAGSLWS